MENNNSNIISNKLDQAPKTWTNYLKRLQDPELQEQIKNAFLMNGLIDNSNESINNEMISWLKEHKKDIPLIQIYQQLSQYPKVSFLFHKKSIEETKNTDFHTLIGWLTPVNYQLQKLWFIYDNNNKKLSEWELWTYLTFEKNDYWQIIVWAEQIEMWWMFTMKEVAAHKKLDLAEFLEYIKQTENKEEKEQTNN